MKIVIYEQHIPTAAAYAAAIKNTMKTAEPELGTTPHDAKGAQLVIANPEPYTTKEWLAAFRAVNPLTPLVLISNSPDLLSGSLGDACYSISKPISLQQLVEITKLSLLGKVYTGGPLSARTEQYTN